MEKVNQVEGGYIMRKYEAPMLSEGCGDMGRVPPAVLLTSAAAGLVAGVSAAFVATGIKKLFGDIVEVRIPALEPCIS